MALAKPDYKLVLEKNYNEILKLYTPLINRYYHMMVKVNNCGYESLTDFIGDFYPELVKAVNAIKIEKIKDQEKFGLYQQLCFYLGNFTTRKLHNEMKWTKFSNDIPEDYKETPYYDKDKTLKMSFDRIYNTCLTDEQRELVNDALKSGKPLYKYGYQMDKIKKIFKEKMDI